LTPDGGRAEDSEGVLLRPDVPHAKRPGSRSIFPDCEGPGGKSDGGSSRIGRIDLPASANERAKKETLLDLWVRTGSLGCGDGSAIVFVVLVNLDVTVPLEHLDVTMPQVHLDVTMPLVYLDLTVPLVF